MWRIANNFSTNISSFVSSLVGEEDPNATVGQQQQHPSSSAAYPSSSSSIPPPSISSSLPSSLPLLHADSSHGELEISSDDGVSVADASLANPPIADYDQILASNYNQRPKTKKSTPIATASSSSSAAAAAADGKSAQEILQEGQQFDQQANQLLADGSPASPSSGDVSYPAADGDGEQSDGSGSEFDEISAVEGAELGPNAAAEADSDSLQIARASASELTARIASGASSLFSSLKKIKMPSMPSVSGGGGGRGNESEVAELIQALHFAETQNKQLVKEYNKIIAEQTEMNRAALEQKENEVIFVNGEYRALNKRYNELESKHRALESESQPQRARLTELTDALAERQAQLDALLSVNRTLSVKTDSLLADKPFDPASDSHTSIDAKELEQIAANASASSNSVQNALVVRLCHALQESNRLVATRQSQIDSLLSGDAAVAAEREKLAAAERAVEKEKFETLVKEYDRESTAWKSKEIELGKNEGIMKLKVESLANEIANLQRALTEKEKHLSAAGEKVTLMELENAGLKDELQANAKLLQEEQTNNTDIIDRLKAAEAELIALKAQLAAATATTASANESAAELKSLREQVSVLEREVTETRNEMENSRMQFAKKSAAVSILEEELEESRLKCRTMEEQCATLEKEMGNLSSGLRMFQEAKDIEIKTLKSELEDLRKQFHRTMDERNNLEQQIDKLANELATTRAALEKSEEHHQQLNAKGSSNEKELTTLQSALTDAQNELNNANKLLEAEKEKNYTANLQQRTAAIDSEKEMDSIKQRLIDAENKIRHYEDTIQRAEVVKNEMANQLQQLTEFSNQTQANNQQLEEQLNALRSATTEAVDQQLASAESANAARSAATAHEESMRELQSQLLALKEEKTSLLSSHYAVEEQLKALKESSSAASSGFADQIHSLHSRIAQLEATLSDSTAQHAAASTAFAARLSEAQSHAESEKELHAQQVHEWKVEIEKLKTELLQEKQKTEQAERHATEAQTAVAAAEAKAAAAAAQTKQTTTHPPPSNADVDPWSSIAENNSNSNISASQNVTKGTFAALAAAQSTSSSGKSELDELDELIASFDK